MVHFIRYFPVYVVRVETQLIGAESLKIRNNVDSAYDTMVRGMLRCLKQMAKVDGDDEDKGHLNYHVILIGRSILDIQALSDDLQENMHYFVAEMVRIDIGSVSSFIKQAEALYDENLYSYVRLILRRSFAKLIVSSG